MLLKSRNLKLVGRGAVLRGIADDMMVYEIP
jgi:hypothetical protein